MMQESLQENITVIPKYWNTVHMYVDTQRCYLHWVIGKISMNKCVNW